LTATNIREALLMLMWVAMVVWIIVVVALTYGWM